MPVSLTRNSSTIARAYALVAASALALAACSGSEQLDEAPPDGPTGAPSEPSQDKASPDPDEDPEDQASDPPPGLDADDLPGESVELFWSDGDLVDVYGVALDDVLYVRELPDPTSDVVAELAPTQTEVHTTGRTRAIEDFGNWLELYVDGEIGWANTFYLGNIGEVSDDTSDVQDPGPQSSLQEVSDAVIAQFDGEPTVVQGPLEGDLISMVTDVRMEGDDSVGGYRMTVYAELNDGEYGLYRLDAAPLCLRGVLDGLCV